MRLEDVRVGTRVRVLPSDAHVHGGRVGTVAAIEQYHRSMMVLVHLDGLENSNVPFLADELEPMGVQA